MSDTRAWQVIVEDAPMDGGGRCQVIQCPNGDFAILRLPTTIYQLAGAGGSYRCVTCKTDWPAPEQTE